MNIKIVTSLFLVLFSSVSFAHGMNALGPNGGYIKMPGAFHTELIDKGATIHVYLLDMGFKNPTTTESAVNIKYKGNIGFNYICKKSTLSFVCEKPKDGLKDIKEIVVNAMRNNEIGKEAVYSLPLKLEK